MDLARARCTEHRDGTPRRSAYVSIYRVLERVPLSALGDLHLATKDGLVLTLQQGQYQPQTDRERFMYQEVCPVGPRVVSTLEPREFCQYVTHVRQPTVHAQDRFCGHAIGQPCGTIPKMAKLVICRIHRSAICVPA